MVYAELAEKLDTAGCRTFWFGAADKEQVLAVVPQNLVRRETGAAMMAKVTQRTELGPVVPQNVVRREMGATTIGIDSGTPETRLHEWRAGRFQFNLENAHLDVPDRKLRGSNVQVVKEHAKSVLPGFTNAIDLGTMNGKPFPERSSLSSLKALGAFLRRDSCGLTR